MRKTSRLGSLHVALTLAACALAPFRAGAGTGWIPPRTVTAVLPNATFAPASVHTMELTLRANGAPASLNWVVTLGGAPPFSVSPSSGFIDVPPDSIRRVTLTVTAPPESSATFSVELTDAPTGWRVGKVTSLVLAATGGRPEVWPAPSWAAPANTLGSIAFQVHSLIASPETLDVTVNRANPDFNNAGAIFPGAVLPGEWFIPANGTITIAVPTTIPGSAYGGNAGVVNFGVSGLNGNSLASGHALVSAALPESLPTALYPVGLVPMQGAAAGRDGPVELTSRGLWLVPAGLEGVRVLRAGLSLNRIGPIDTVASGTDDRLVGRVRIPSYAASVAVVPGFVGPAGDTLDLGLVAAGRAGLMLVDLRTIVDPPMITWEDAFDQDMNGIDDRILRTIPIPGFATDVAWFRAPTGRIVALVAAADTGSVPVAASYNPASVVAGTGAGVVAIDVTAAIDSLGAVPFAAGMLPTPGSALDLELRRAGTGAPDLAIADGAAGVSVYHLTTATGPPATVTFTSVGSVALSAAWGAPYARDLCWVSNTPDSTYLAVGAGAGGMQVLRAPLAGAPSLVLAQQTLAPAIGLGGAFMGSMGVAMGTGGVALMRIPRPDELDQIAPAASAPYTAPVLLARNQRWTEGRALEATWHWTPSAAASSLRFGGPDPVPDLLVSDGPRTLVLRPGSSIIVGVAEERTPPRAVPLRVSMSPNPSPGSAAIHVFDASARLNSAPLEAMVFDVQGRRVVKGAKSRGGEISAGSATFLWDGRDDRGRRLGSGRYWLRVRQGDRSATLPFLILR